MTQAVAAVKEHWTTFWALVAASADAIRRQWRLVVFAPLLALVTLSLTWWLLAMMGISGRSLISRLQQWWPLALLAFWYLTNVIVTFWSVALTSAALSALRQQPVSFEAAHRAAFRRLPAILGFALVASTFGALFNALERRSQWVVRASVAVLGFSWTLLSLFALTAMAGERLGTVDALRRGGVLMRASWAEKRLTTLGMGLLWVPLLAIESAMLGAVVDWKPDAVESGQGHLFGGVLPDRFLIAIALVGGINTVLWATFWMLERVYVAAVYCYAVEGVVPSSFAGDRLERFWQAVGASARSAKDAEGGTGALRGWLRRQQLQQGRQRTLLAVGLMSILSLAYVVSRPGVLDLIRHMFPEPGVAVTDDTFPGSPKLYATMTISEGAGAQAVASGPTSRGASVLVFQHRGTTTLGRKLRLLGHSPLPTEVEWIDRVQPLETPSGRRVFVGTAKDANFDEMVLAFGEDGDVLFKRSAIHDGRDLMYKGIVVRGFPLRVGWAHGVDALAPIRTPTGWGVAVGYSSFHGLCFLDQSGAEKWCNTDVGNLRFVTSMDCDGDGWEEIVSASPNRETEAACYSFDGRVVREIHLPGLVVLALRASDLDGDGKKELTYVARELNGSVRFGACRADGTKVVEVHVADDDWSWIRSSAPMAVRRSAGGPKDIAMLGPGGQLLGLSWNGQRWKAGSGYTHMTVIDLDGDGLDEVIGVGPRPGRDRSEGVQVTAWSWNPKGEPVVWSIPD